MLYASFVAGLLAFQAPGLHNAPTAARIGSSPAMAERKGAFWQRADWQEASAAASAASAAATPAAAPAASASLSVAQACTFMEMEPSVSFEEKKAFLLSKGVSEFVVAEAACTAPDTTLVL